MFTSKYVQNYCTYSSRCETEALPSTLLYTIIFIRFASSAMDTQQDTAVPAWEAAKENVLPIKRGRSAKGLSVSLAHPVSQDTLNADQDRAFEAQLENNTVTDPVQRLELYVKYLKWVRDTFPSVTDKALQILEVKNTHSVKPHFSDT